MPRTSWGWSLRGTLGRENRQDRQSFPAKILISFALSTCLLISALLLFGLRQGCEQDHAEIRYTRTALVAAMDAKAKNLRSWLKGYAFWDDLYLRIVRSNDKAWSTKIWDRALGRRSRCQ